VFPETFEPFLLGNADVRKVFMAHHAELLDAGFWQAHQRRIAEGYVHDVFPYDSAKRFAVQRGAARQVAPPAANETASRPHSPVRAEGGSHA
jgi:isocitrate dehydrogenase kinase/phosphatase